MVDYIYCVISDIPLLKYVKRIYRISVNNDVCFKA